MEPPSNLPLVRHVSQNAVNGHRPAAWRTLPMNLQLAVTHSQTLSELCEALQTCVQFVQNQILSSENWLPVYSSSESESSDPNLEFADSDQEL